MDEQKQINEKDNDNESLREQKRFSGCPKPIFIVRNSLKVDFNILATMEALEQQDMGSLDDNQTGKVSLLHQYLIILDHKTTINFRDQNSLICLTKAILKYIFKVRYWNCPYQNLCPRVANRLNYIIWLNQLLGGNNQEKVILDIGTGATLIYPLLGHKVFGWKFYASEAEIESYHHAHQLIKRNELEDQIKICQVKKSSDEKVIYFNQVEESYSKDFKERKKKGAFLIDAVICNPPFYDSERNEPETISQMTKGEYEAEGGEFGFFFAMYRESFTLHSLGKVDHFTILIGRERDFVEIVSFLKKEQSQSKTLKLWKVGQIEQGRNIRFIVAWKPCTLSS